MPNSIFILVCKRCGHEWPSKSKKPLRCGKCKSPYWDREKANRRVQT